MPLFDLRWRRLMMTVRGIFPGTLHKPPSILFRENELDHVRRLSEKSLSEFRKIASKLQSKHDHYEAKLLEISGETLRLIDESGLQHKDFSGGYYPNFMMKVNHGKDLTFGTKWQETLRDKPLYPGRLLKESPHTALVMDELTPTLAGGIRPDKTIVLQKEVCKIFTE